MTYVKLRAAVLALWLALVAPHLAAAKTLIIDVDDDFNLYVDGVEQTNLPGAAIWGVPDQVTLQTNPTVIAVNGINAEGGPMGIIATIDDTNFVTDFSWKCSDIPSNNWFATDFDDSGWPWAVLATLKKTGGTPMKGINTIAQWIWTKTQNSTNAGAQVWCRGYPTKTLVINVDDRMVLYIDGVQQTNLKNDQKYWLTDSIVLVNNPGVLAVQGTNAESGPMGIIASLSHSPFVTDFTWKCTDTLTDNWSDPSFDDSAWPTAVAAVSKKTVAPFAGMSPDAQWIWTATQDTTVKGPVVYCRGHKKF